MDDNPVAFPPWPAFSDLEVEAVVKVLRSGKVNYWTGDEGKAFEAEFASHVGVKHAIAVANGSVALEIALKAMGIGPGDDVIVTSRSFIASASCVVACGARPVFADVDFRSQNITAESVERALTPQTRAVVAVHLMGWPCEMDELMALAAKRGIKVLEDCAQAHGATCKGRVVGSIGHAAAFSFCQDKIMTTGGEGGMVTTNDSNLWRAAWSLKEHGKDYDAAFNRQHPPGYRWLHESFGTNLRITEMQAAIGRVQLGLLPEWLKARRENARLLDAGFSRIPGLMVRTAPAHMEHAYYKYYVTLQREALKSGWSRDRVLGEINARGIPCFNTYGGEIYRDLAFRKAGLLPGQEATNAARLGEDCLQFLVHPTLGESHMHATIDVTEKVMAGAVS